MNVKIDEVKVAMKQGKIIDESMIEAVEGTKETMKRLRNHIIRYKSQVKNIVQQFTLGDLFTFKQPKKNVESIVRQRIDSKKPFETEVTKSDGSKNNLTSPAISPEGS